MQLRFTGLETNEVDGFRGGARDANGEAPLDQRGGGVGPCRHCLALLQKDDRKLILGYRPFATLHPYSEVGPIFLHANECPRYDAAEPPGWFEFLEPAVVRGYGDDHWIVYETGAVVPGRGVASACREILARDDVAYVHVRSKFGCFQCRVDRR